jgi:GntR family transcriptional regulator
MTSRKLVRHPLYVQLKQILKELTKGDEFRVGDKFLTERQISERFDVSRVTANKALSNLVAEGVLSFRKGVGTFVEDTARDSTFPGVATSFTNKTLAAGRCPSTRLLSFARITAEKLPAHVAARFPASAGEEIAVAERLRLADDVPMILERHFFRLQILPGLSEEDVRVSVYDSLTKKYRQRYSTVEETIRTIVVRGQDSTLLGVGQGTPGILMFFMARNHEEEPVYFAEVIYRGDAYEFHNRLGPIQKTHTQEEGPAEFTSG